MRGLEKAFPFFPPAGTAPQDFGMLLDAACLYDKHASQPQHASSLPDVLFLITGEQEGLCQVLESCVCDCDGYVAADLIFCGV